MIDHLELQTRKTEATVNFYRDTLGPLGYRLILDGAAKGFGLAGAMDLFIVEGEPSANVHFAFAAESRAKVDEAWRAGELAGHVTDRPPALAPKVHANYYAGYLRDPDGRLVELVCQRPE
ncbi:VOC family protein [Sphingomonas sp.]|uniref:VOC family protein n=1 Tax=Sphingomonas sp. TaxID=28214 RepID=UPI00286A62F7|nr:VOC family protein [Sphingomonas sp.]